MVILNDPSPMIKLRVLYIGSAVPLETTEGLDAVQGPLRERYPVDNESSMEGIDAILTITNSCIQLQYLNDTDHVIQFPISSLTLCAAVRCVNTTNGATGEISPKFVSLQDPLAGGENSRRPAIFTAITRRSQGRKVLECHGFVCQSSRDALNLVKCAKIAGTNFKKNGSVAPTPRVVKPTTTQTATATLNSERYYNITGNRLSGDSSHFVRGASTPTNTTAQNGQPNGTAMRLIPAEPVSQKIAAGPEFFEPVSTQGYFYSSNNAEVKKYNILRDTTKENVEPAPPSPGVNGGTPVNGVEAPTVNGTPTPVNVTPTPRQAPSRRTTASRGPPPPIYIRHPGQGPPGPFPPPPMFYRPPPPHPMFMRPRFFSPPPPRLRPHPFAMPPGGPPPMPVYAPPIYVRRPRRNSEGSSRSKSNSSRGSRGSRSRSKTPTGDANGDTTEPKRRIPNADDSSDESLPHRPSTPPTDYDDRKKKGERMSRRDTYEVRAGFERRHPSPRRMMAPPPDVIPPYANDYYVYPPRNGGYAPFTMYNPHGRSRSMPPQERDRHRSKSPHKKKSKKKHKKQKKSKYQPKQRIIYAPPFPYPRYPGYPPPHSDVSTESMAGYNSEIPIRKRPGDAGHNEYSFYPPRDFRRDENQFMNERNFSKSIVKETRRSHDSRSYPTAYEINDALDRGMPAPKDGDADFNLY